MHRFDGVADEVGLDGFGGGVGAAVAGCVFCCDAVIILSDQCLQGMVIWGFSGEHTPSGLGFRVSSSILRSIVRIGRHGRRWRWECELCGWSKG